MYIQSVSQRVGAGLWGAMSPDIMAPATSPPWTSLRWSQPVSSYQGGWYAADSTPMSARNSLACSRASSSTILPPIEQPSTTGRSSAMARQKARIIPT